MRLGLKTCNRLYSTSTSISAAATTAAATTSISRKPLFRFGVIADVQYADIDDTYNYSHTKTRHYRRSAEVLRNAISWWNSYQSPAINFVVNLGDLIDGRNRGLNIQARAMRKIMPEFDALHCPKLLHTVGNHELYCFTRAALSEHRIFPPSRQQFSLTRPDSLGHDEFPSGDSSCFYYSFKPADNWLVIVLDPYDVSVMRHGGGRHGYEHFKGAGLDSEAYDLCQSHNPNDIGGKNDFFANLTGRESRWAPVNGAVGEEQLNWLRHVLETCHHRNTNVIIFSHVILHPDATRNHNCRGLLWNYDKVLEVESSPRAGLLDLPAQSIYEFPCTRLVLAGHIHNEVYHLDDHGVHHLTLPSPLESIKDECSIVAEVMTSGDIHVVPQGDITERLLLHQELR